MSNHVKTVVVLGSKPNATLPDVNAEVVVTANGAAELGVVYRQKYGTKIITLVHNRDLVNHNHIRESISKAKPETLILIDDLRGINNPVASAAKMVNLPPENISLISPFDSNWRFTKVLGWRRYCFLLERIFSRDLRNVFKFVLPDILVEANFYTLKRSTGVSAILYSKLTYNTADIIVAGIGLKPGGHFNGVGNFGKKSADRDKALLGYWNTAYRKKIWTTDEDLSIFWHVPIWRGSNFVQLNY